MSAPPLAVFSIPDRFEIEGPLVARHLEEPDVPIVAPAFRDPGIGGENGMPPLDEDGLRAILRERIPEMRARGVLVPYVIEDTTDGSLLGGVTLRHFDPMRGVIEVGYWLFAHARGRGLATRAVRAVAREAFSSGLWRVEAHCELGTRPRSVSSSAPGSRVRASSVASSAMTASASTQRSSHCSPTTETLVVSRSRPCCHGVCIAFRL
jgi:RimJ/RimL family protein N-acetyltransferase